MGRDKEGWGWGGGGGLDNWAWGEAGFVILELNTMVAGWSGSYKTSSVWLRDPALSPKATAGHLWASGSEQDQGIGTPSILLPLSWNIFLSN